MPDTVVSKTIWEGSKLSIQTFSNFSDGSGETNVNKVDISTLTGSPSTVKVRKIWYSVYGMAVRMSFDHTTDFVFKMLQGDGFLDFTSFGGIPSSLGSGGTGDILFTTLGASSGDSYDITLELGL